ncbi:MULTISPECIES: hypothetical protein [Acinetobacter]|jgi:hypothetical protein|uniref:hypothetical protein n=1 Tax=Acinetobacter TaxID=469 RepID=UPI000C32D67C|nr:MULTISPECIES: hypothetical protein [Acinetobacter]MCR8952966.1 hypothetical protein [Acinetobacter baumannii]PKH30658.1 hypothetical protein BJF94_09155 [Acinetobacter radioresistens]
MDVKSKVATEIALKAFDQVKSSDKWNDLLLDDIDWAQLAKLLPQDDLDEMLNKLNIHQESFDQLIKELNDKVDQELEMLSKCES